ncbi:hypothetical protein BD309DRAFT_349696 [Dichomitus squalens]|nr:hypothetical protein BD309DRAFT_349696 [Dichomitus squalens]
MFCIDALTPIIGVSYTLIVVLVGLRESGGVAQRIGASVLTSYGYGRSSTRTSSQPLLMTVPWMKVPLAAATVSSTFNSDIEGAAYLSTSREQFVKKVNSWSPNVHKALPALPSESNTTGETPPDLEAGKPTRPYGYF